ncbi:MULTISPECIES: lytic transglycosylase F [Vibrio]|uniref:transglycosylase SLT domain-containing protein n=1 Tax=Vibrio TaxID=662 RepID=UPI0020756560|nr:MULTISPECIES: lytic transglycosylase F [Vibrio]USD33034.1 lytic transglycosylase F [Vibrio sp. SCSIO 43186]USD46103.1 lytic transglycosylase F [Vibrio sp. SCSIO 43145]USD70158.1 lytic transglycosylase F [Vibrio sp. SCSIO 43139]USD95073.1 lytic transglycosylase F [Vibrio coralliilyticus]
MSRTVLILILFAATWNHATALSLSPLQKTPYFGDLAELEKKGVIRVLVSADLGFYYIEGGQPKGILAELLYHFEKELRQRSSYFNLQIIPVHRDELLPSLEKGYGDLIVANLTITSYRSEYIDFSIPVLQGVSELLVTRSTTPTITDLKQLSGKEIWVRASSSYFESLQKVNRMLDEHNLQPVTIRFVEETLQDIEIIELVNQGHIDATVLDSHKTELWLKVMENISVHDQAPLRTDGKIAWAMRKQSPLLQSFVNQYLQRTRSGTLLGNVIYDKYLDHTGWLKRILNPEHVTRLDALSEIFANYSAQYDFDPLMISAQGFQESGLDQSKVSHKGAVGVMQVLPSTAKDPNIAIPDIYQVDNNIHAGVKYMRFLKDRYFSDDDITPDNQVYFSLAAYNAGPANIRKMRRLASQQGYDPNQWFRHVEIIARRHIGREPVHYVSNINRYFIIYKQLNALKQQGHTPSSSADIPDLFVPNIDE